MKIRSIRNLDGPNVYLYLSEEQPEQVVSVFDLRLHILSGGDQFDLDTRRPSRPARKDEPAA